MRRAFQKLFLAAGVALAILAPVSPAPAQLVGLPSAVELSPAGLQLVLDYEVGGGAPYYRAHLARPTWPGAASGVTVGVGYDCGYNAAAVIRSDWQDLDGDDVDRLADTAGVTGTRARPRAADLRDILIPWAAAETVFQRVTLTRFHALTRRTFPGFNDLHPDARAALVSLVFNRGSSMTGPGRVEMRAIRDLVPRRDYRGIAREIRRMERLWEGRGLEGLLRRREAEARLVERAGE